MFGKLMSPLTTANSGGVAVRYGTVIIGTILAIAGVFGVLSPEQVEALTAKLPEFVSALGGIATMAVTLYAIITKSSSDKAAEVAKQIDAKIPAGQTVTIKTPEGEPDIKVAAK